MFQLNQKHCSAGFAVRRSYSFLVHVPKTGGEKKCGTWGNGCQDNGHVFNSRVHGDRCHLFPDSPGALCWQHIGDSAVLLFSKLNKIFFGYFAPENLFLDNENKYLSG